MDNSLIIQICIFSLLMILIHIYFLFNKLFIKEKKVSLNDNNIVFILVGFLIIGIIFIFFYNEFLMNGNLRNEDTKESIANWGAFGSYFGGFAAPILTFFTLIILIKQISVSREANNQQIEHLNKTRRIEILINFINELANKTESKIDERHPITTEDLIKLCIKKDTKNINLKDWKNDYQEKIFIIKYSDDTEDEFDWLNASTYLSKINEEYKAKAKDNLESNKYLHSQCKNISILIKKLIALCTELSNLDENSYQIIKFSLITFTKSVEELKKVDLIKEKDYQLFFQLISIHNNNEDSIKEDLKKLFAKEVSNKYGKNLTEKNLSTINFEFVNKDEFKVGQFTTEIDGTIYSRKDGNWIAEKKL